MIDEDDNQYECPEKYEKVNIQMLNSYQNWIVVIFLYEHYLADFLKYMKEVDSSFKFVSEKDRKIASAFF